MIGLVPWWHNPRLVKAWCETAEAIGREAKAKQDAKRPRLVHAQHVRRSPRRPFLLYTVTGSDVSEVRQSA